MEHTPDNEPTEERPPTERPQQGGATREAGPQSPAPETPPAAPRRLTRSSEDRVIAGVCGGIARHFGIDATLVRIAAVVVTLLGGAGALLYVAALLLMPSDSQDADAPAANRALTVVGIGLLLLVTWPLILGGGFLLAGLAMPLAVLALAGLAVWWLVSGEGPGGSGRDVARRAALGVGVLVLCGAVALGGGLAAGLGGGVVVAALVIVAGLMLIAGAFFGGVRWLILPAVSLALAVGLVSAAGIDLEGGVGERDYRPSTLGDLRDGYRVGMGRLVVDLRDVDLPAGDTPLKLDVGLGEARVIVSEDVCVASAAQIGIGGVEVFRRENGGIDVDWDDRPRAASGSSRVVIDADVGVGALVVRHDRSNDGFGPGRRFGRFRDGDGDDVGNVGCRGTGEGR